MNEHWIPMGRVLVWLTQEFYLISAAILAAGYLFYRLFLSRISVKRHQSLNRRMLRLITLLAASGALRVASWAALASVDSPRLSAYFALGALGVGAVFVVFEAAYYLYLYLFMTNRSIGVPRLIANLFTLVFGLFVFGVLTSSVFEVQLAPLIATSAVFSVILGLALQDTLGNLFSGVALQFDKPFGIGDWVEIQNGTQKWVGQIHEVSWRATLLVGFMDELISIPNRTMAQSQVIVYSHSQKPVRRSQEFRFPFHAPLAAARQALLDSVRGVQGILADPAPAVLITETTESWITLKLFYSVTDFGIQYRIGDRLFSQALDCIRAAGLTLAHNRMEVGMLSAGSAGWAATDARQPSFSLPNSE